MNLLVFIIPAVIRLFYTLCGASSIYFAAKELKRCRYFAFGCWVIMAVDFISKLIAVGA